ncbi:Crp/Fnr family transcriptional regulator [Actinocrispum wychmicini]|uniref:CRP-like cAMP-binding protein n=1 Tax=Actinocrispum wychmicini TaxID=1213861 RepID=A0A4R2JJQ3_9PSEU|nr:Crp/Fnr family transcriptional regulator [Actinocrispum wychmicini]TCO57248.1 CRP-like cAMP-binding protein [Actinocrispum wychmicini]
MDTGQDSFWGRLGPAERKAIESLATRRGYRPGDFLCHEGDETNHVIIVLSGSVRVLSHSIDDRAVVIGVRTPGDIIGEQAALDNRPRSATLQAVDEVEVITLTGSRFANLCQSHARLSWALLGVFSGRLRDMGRQRTEYGGGSASRRVFAQLAEMAVQSRSGHTNGSGSAIEIRHRSTQQQLAANAATSRESYARALRDLRERGIISTGRGWILIHRPDELQRLAR